MLFFGGVSSILIYCGMSGSEICWNEFVYKFEFEFSFLVTVQGVRQFLTLFMHRLCSFHQSGNNSINEVGVV